MASPVCRAVLGFLLMLAIASPASAQNRVLNFRFTPTKRAQFAIWIERPDGSFVATVALTEAVALRGIGNRPGALQMNTGFRWPYGRREGVLPVWAHRRASAPGAQLFPLVIFQDRDSCVGTNDYGAARCQPFAAYEGYASRTRDDSSPDTYFCLSFQNSKTSDVDAVSCPSIFNSDKGRYITQADVAARYGEPYERLPGFGAVRPLPLFSFYPPRRDVGRTAASCPSGPDGLCDTLDVTSFETDALAIMPELDAISRATPPADQTQTLQFVVPGTWPDGDYVAWIEVNTEIDYNETYNTTSYPTPKSPNGAWDSWALTFGVPYRGQPSVVYSVPFTLNIAGTNAITSAPLGYGDLEGATGTLHPIDATITDDAAAHPGSGADRLRSVDGLARFSVSSVAIDPCQSAAPPPACSITCDSDAPCPAGFLCGSGGTCVGQCSVATEPGPVTNLVAANYPDPKHSHQWARVSFTTSESRRPVVGYDFRFTDRPMATDQEFMQAWNAKAATLEGEAVTVCPPDAQGNPACPAPGTSDQVDIGGMHFLTTYNVGLRAIDACGAVGPLATTSVHTTEVHFTQVSPCFVATASYGSAMAPDVVALRRFRDETLRSSSVGRAAVDAYYAIGPTLASLIRDDEFLRRVARALLAPSVMGVRLFDAVPSH